MDFIIILPVKHKKKKLPEIMPCWFKHKPKWAHMHRRAHETIQQIRSLNKRMCALLADHFYGIVAAVALFLYSYSLITPK